MKGRYVALLRGINVGGKHVVPMKELVAAFEAAGCEDVRTYVQSGNVCFAAGAAVAKAAGARVTAAIGKSRGFAPPVVLRSATEIATVFRANPFLASGAPPEQLYVAFLAKAPTKAQVASLDPARSPPDEVVVRGADAYLRLPNGAGRTKLTSAYLDAKLGTISTARNWRTVTALVAMTE